jgi:hypothetical protein
MPDTNDFHGMKNILLNNDDWMVVDPLDYNAFVYYAPEKFKGSWNQFREGDTYFVIDKNNQSNNGLVTYTIHKEDGKIEYYNAYGTARPKMDVLVEFPDEVKSVVDNIIGQSDIYKLLLSIKNGERVGSTQMERADDLVWKFIYNEKNPSKSMVKLRFDDIEDYLKLFDMDEYDISFAESVYSHYDGANFIDYDHGYNEWNEGYLLYQFSDENITKLKQILRLISPSTAKLDTDEDREESSKLLEKMFSDEVDYIITDWTDEENNCRNNGAKEWIESDTCDYFSNYGLIRQDCFRDYYTTSSILLSLYNNVGDKTLSLREVLTNIGHRDSNIGGWDENRWEISCNDFDEKSFNESVERQLDKIFEKIEDSDEFINVYEYSNIFNRITKNYHLNNRYNTKSGREFFIRKIDPATNKIIVQVFKKDGGGLEDRSYTEEEFNNFLVSPELFEGFIRIN